MRVRQEGETPPVNRICSEGLGGATESGRLDFAHQLPPGGRKRGGLRAVALFCYAPRGLALMFPDAPARFEGDRLHRPAALLSLLP